MDEQHRRRRRVQAPDGEQTQPTSAVPAAENPSAAQPSPNETPSHTGEQAHHRRRAPSNTPPETEMKKPAPPVDDGSIFWHPESELLDQAAAEEPKKAEHNPLKAIAAVDAAVCRIGDGCIDLLRHTGSGVKRVAKGVGSLQEKKKRKLRSAGTHTGKRIRGKATQAAQKAETAAGVTLVKPEDYRGMGAAHMAEPTPRRHPPKKKTRAGYLAAMVCLLCVALVSAYMVGSIVWRSISTKRLNDSLSDLYSELSSEADASTAVPQSTPAPDEEEIKTLLAAIESNPPMTMPEQQKDDDRPVVTAAPKAKDAVKSTKFHQIGGDALPEMEALYQANRDLTGWLRMEGILDLPVVYKDNDYYLTRDFYKNKSASGTIFLDENHPFRENAQNLLLHGHNMKDGTMFGRLVQYETNLQFLKNNPFIQYSSLWKKEQYVIFAVLHVSLNPHDDRFFNYFTHHTFSSDMQFETYVRALQNQSVYSIPVDVRPSDALLTLSTCLEENRLVIVARRLREGESKSDLRHVVQLAARQ